MNAKNILKLDKDSISEFQKEIYNGSERDPMLGTRFSLDVGKRAQASHIKLKLEQMPRGKDEVVYKASKKFDNLMSLEAHVQLFPVKVKEQFSKSVSICYHHNLGHNIFPFGECKLDDDHCEYIDSTWLDIYSQYFVKKRKMYQRKIGNVPCLEDWDTFLPGLALVIPQPYSFTRKPQVSLPLMKSSKNSVTFEYKLRTKLVDLIRMRVLKPDGEYKEIKCNLKYLDFKSETLPIPEMWGRYSEYTEEERNWRKAIDERTGEQFKQIIYTEDIDITSSKNPKSLGMTDTIPLETLSPAKHIFWVASLVDGNLSNYTTNSSNVRLGWNPCARSGIKYGGTDRVEELSHEHFDLSEPSDFEFPKTPKEEGFNVFTYTFNPIEIQHADNAVILKNCGASLNVTLGDTNPFLQDDCDQEQTDENGEIVPIEALENNDLNGSKKDRYIVHVRTMIMRKLEVTWDDKSESVKYNFS